MAWTILRSAPTHMNIERRQQSIHDPRTIALAGLAQYKFATPQRQTPAGVTSAVGHFRPRQVALPRDPLPLDPESGRQVLMRNWSRWAQ